MSRKIPFCPDEICDICGALGAYDFMGDLVCELCLPEDTTMLDEYDPELDSDLDQDESFGFPPDEEGNL